MATADPSTADAGTVTGPQAPAPGHDGPRPGAGRPTAAQAPGPGDGTQATGMDQPAGSPVMVTVADPTPTGTVTA